MKAKNYLYILFPLTVVGIIFRVVELLYGVEAETGYYVRESSLYIFFNIFILAGVIVLLSQMIWRVKSKVVPKKSVIRICPDPFSFSGIMFLLSAAGIAASSFIRIYTTDSVIKSFANGVGEVTLKNVFADFDVWILLAGILSAVVLVVFAVDPRKCVNRTFFNVLTLAPVLYYALRTLDLFSEKSSILSRAYDSFTILALGFMTLFFMSFAKMIVGMPSRRTLCGFGSVAFFLGLIRIAETVLYFIGSNKFGVDVEPATAISDIIVSLCVCVFLLRLHALPETREKPIANNSDNASK